MPVKQAAIYIRVSTARQAEEGDSLPAQRETLTEWAKAHGYIVVAEYCDAGESARVADRPEFVRMLKDARQSPRPFDAVLVWKWDRFARNMDDAIVYKGLLRRQLGLEVFSVGDPQTTGAVGVLLERILDVVAEFQSLITADNVKNTMAYLARNGRWLGKVPFGFTLDSEGKLAVQEEEAEAVRWAFREVGRREQSVSSTAEVFASGARFPATIRKGYKWSPQAVRQMLQNRVYIGEAIWNRRYTLIDSSGGTSKKVRRKRDTEEWVVVPEAYLAIVDRETFDAAQRVLDAIGAKYARTPYGDYLFRSLVRCARCGHQMVLYAPSNGTKARLACSQYFRIPTVACRPFNYVRPEELRAAVVETMQRILKGAPAPSDVEIKVVKSTRTRSPEAVLEALRQRLQRLMDAYEAGAITLDEFRARRGVLDAEIARAEEAVRSEREGEGSKTRLLHHLREQIAGVAPLLDDGQAAVTQLNAALARVIDHIDIDRVAGSIRITWRLEFPG